MTSDSKIFVGLRPTRKKPVQHVPSIGPKCQWDGCTKEGTHRAPVGAAAPGLYLVFCSAHVRDYSSGYNFVSTLSDPVTARYQKEAASGARPTWGTRIVEPAETPLPSSVRSGTAKSINARKRATQDLETKAKAQQRKLKVLEAKAFERLDLPENATPDEIRRRYKERLKLHHPDANDGDRTLEGDLQATIEAYKILKLNGFC